MLTFAEHKQTWSGLAVSSSAAVSKTALDHFTGVFLMTTDVKDLSTRDYFRKSQVVRSIFKR